MWNRQKLADIARKRKAALADVEGALLAFSRTQEMTDEAGIDVNTSERELEAALDRLEPDAAAKIMMLGSVERDEMLRDFIVKMMDHNQSRIDKDLKQVQELTITEKLESPDNEKAAPAKKRKRGLRLF